jgi:hypothetical protein
MPLRSYVTISPAHLGQRIARGAEFEGLSVEFMVSFLRVRVCGWMVFGWMACGVVR